MTTYETINLCADVFSFLVIIVLAIGTLLSGNLREKPTRWFLLLLLFIVLGIIDEVIVGALAGTSGQARYYVIRGADYLSYVLWGLQIIALSCYVYAYLSTKTKISQKPFYVIIFFGIMTIVMATVAQFTSLYTAFDELNRFYQQDTFWVSMIFPTLALLLYTGIVVRYRKALRVREWVSLLGYGAMYISLYALSYFNPELWIAYAGVTLSVLIIYSNVQVELKHRLAEQEIQLSESRTAVMLSQIQPHFLYNSLTAISGQCKESPQAQESILLFSQYLRGNMDSLFQKTPISFEDELEHTKRYLELEKLRFGERLQVKYDIKVIDFALPVLTLQPLVENAVRHGVTKKQQGGTIVIRTEESEQSILIVVEDDGEGFVSAAALHDGRKHIGIENVQDRLERLCGGRLSIKSVPDRGTVATIELPKVG